MTISDSRLRLVFLSAVLAVTLFAACATPAQQLAAVTPAPCVDAALVALRRDHPGSLSERDWQRVQNVERECAQARAHGRARGPTPVRERSIDAHHAIGMAAIMTAVMVGMMIAMW